MRCHLRLATLLATVAPAVLCHQAAAAGTGGTINAASKSDTEEQVIVTGTRDPHKKARDSVSPVTVVSGAELRATGQTDLRDALTLLVPSLSHQSVGTGTANTVDSINLRGLTSNQVLVLVNGKRRHTSATVYYSPGPQQGTTPVDIDMIPASEIDHIEVLQDGAAAQYGSDAIAGVINVILKQQKHGFTASANNGGYDAGDGFTSGEALSGAFTLPNGGFFDLGADVKFQDHTMRGGLDNRTGRVDNPIISNPRELRENIGYNMGYDINDNISLYSFSTYGHRNAEALQNYRTRSTFPTVYPLGFVPNIANSENDYGVTVGFRGSTILGLDYDVSTTYGGNHNSVDIYNTGSQTDLQTLGYTPSRFHQTAYDDTQWTNNVDLRRSFDTGLLAAPLNLALGGEYRYESYGIDAGEYLAYVGTGAQGQHGITPNLANTSYRDVTAGYIDLSTQLLRHWQVDLAGRFEHYTDAGDTETGKLSTRYDFNKYVAIRGTVSNGFRAPTLAEEHFSSLSVTPTGATGVLATDSIAARALGSSPLKPERSISYSAGILVNPMTNMHLSLDGYQIDIRDRIVNGGVYNGTTAINALEAQGLSLPSGLLPSAVNASYFSNAASTRTYGMDIVGNYLMRLGRYGQINWDVAVNFNQTKILSVADDRNGNVLLNAQQQGFLTSYFPRNKTIFGGRWSNGKFDITLHEIRYGHTTSQLTYYNTGTSLDNSNTHFLRFQQQPKYQTDLALGYQVTRAVHATLGATNLFNARPSTLPYIAQYLGGEIYNTDVQQLGLMGGFYYLQLDVRL